MKIIVKKNYQETSLEAANIVKELLQKKDDAVLGLATGSTPIGMYNELIKMNKNNEISFKNVKTVNLDEYIGLDGNHNQSYRYFMNENFFNYIDIDKNNTYIESGIAKDLELEAKNYEKLIDDLGGQDIQILGIGENGHIGFNEPAEVLELYTHTEDLTQSTISANARFFNTIDEVPTRAISMGIGSIFKAKHIVLIATGKKKALIMKTFKDSKITPLIPASLLKLHPNVTIIMDEEAAE